MVARIAKIVEDAQNKKSKTQRLMDKCAKYYTPGLLVQLSSAPKYLDHVISYLLNYFLQN